MPSSRGRERKVSCLRRPWSPGACCSLWWPGLPLVPAQPCCLLLRVVPVPDVLPHPHRALPSGLREPSVCGHHRLQPGTGSPATPVSPPQQASLPSRRLVSPAFVSPRATRHWRLPRPLPAHTRTSSWAPERPMPSMTCWTQLWSTAPATSTFSSSGRNPWSRVRGRAIMVPAHCPLCSEIRGTCWGPERWIQVFLAVTAPPPCSVIMASSYPRPELKCPYLQKRHGQDN